MHRSDLVVNEPEALRMTGAPDAEAAAGELAATGADAVVVTLGAHGALWTDGRVTLEAPARAAAPRDTTGAGDAFAAGFLSAWLDGAAPGAALEAGNALAARAVTGHD